MIAAADLLSQALLLPPDQRAEIAQVLLESLPGDDTTSAPLHEEWEQEIMRRVERHAAGQAKVVDLDEFKRALRAAATGTRSP